MAGNENDEGSPRSKSGSTGENAFIISQRRNDGAVIVLARQNANTRVCASADTFACRVILQRALNCTIEKH